MSREHIDFVIGNVYYLSHGGTHKAPFMIVGRASDGGYECRGYGEQHINWRFWLHEDSSLATMVRLHIDLTNRLKIKEALGV